MGRILDGKLIEAMGPIKSIEDLKGCLIKEGKNPKLMDENGQSLMHWGAYGGNLGNMQWLACQYEFDISLQDDSGNTPAHMAVMGSPHLDVVTWLVKAKGVDPCQKNHAGETVQSLFLANGGSKDQWLKEIGIICDEELSGMENGGDFGIGNTVQYLLAVAEPPQLPFIDVDIGLLGCGF